MSPVEYLATWLRDSDEYCASVQMPASAYRRQARELFAHLARMQISAGMKVEYMACTENDTPEGAWEAMCAAAAREDER